MILNRPIRSAQFPFQRIRLRGFNELPGMGSDPLILEVWIDEYRAQLVVPALEDLDDEAPNDSAVQKYLVAVTLVVREQPFM